jgi:hypothetical protein
MMHSFIHLIIYSSHYIYIYIYIHISSLLACLLLLGNHDTSLDTRYYVDRGHARFHSHGKSTKTAEEISSICVNLVRTCASTYLEDESVEVSVSRSSEASGVFPLHIYGSPWSPEFCDWVCMYVCCLFIVYLKK